MLKDCWYGTIFSAKYFRLKYAKMQICGIQFFLRYNRSYPNFSITQLGTEPSRIRMDIRIYKNNIPNKVKESIELETILIEKNHQLKITVVLAELILKYINGLNSYRIKIAILRIFPHNNIYLRKRRSYQSRTQYNARK